MITAQEAKQYYEDNFITTLEAKILEAASKGYRLISMTHLPEDVIKELEDNGFRVWQETVGYTTWWVQW